MKNKKRFVKYLEEAHDIISTMLYDVECDKEFPTTYDRVKLRRAKTIISRADAHINNKKTSK